MSQPKVILTGFADEGPVSKRAEEQLTMCRALGLSYYSLRFIDVGEGVKNVMLLTDSEVARLQKLHEEFEIRVSSIGSPIGKVKLLDVDDGTSNRYVPFERYLTEEVSRAVELAQAFGAKLIRGFSFYPPKGDDPWKYVELAAHHLAAITEVCQQGGVFFGLEVEANLVGRNGELLQALASQVDHPHLRLVFDGANFICQGYSAAETFQHYALMKNRLGWLHIKDYELEPDFEGKDYVDEEMLRHFVPADRGDVGHERILRDLKGLLPALTEELQALGLPGFFLDLEPHLKGGGQFGGFSGVDGYGVALRALCRVLDYVGIGYDLTCYDDLRKA
jgi:sugar phosphate isomerase/epimerase